MSMKINSIIMPSTELIQCQSLSRTDSHVKNELLLSASREFKVVTGQGMKECAWGNGNRDTHDLTELLTKALQCRLSTRTRTPTARLKSVD